MVKHINSSLTQTITNTIRLHRLQKGYSQEYMSLELKISQNAYSRLERGLTKLDVERLHEISTLLGVDISMFFNYIPTPDCNLYNKNISR